MEAGTGGLKPAFTTWKRLLPYLTESCPCSIPPILSICRKGPMSAPLAGKFQDHYEVLGIEPASSSETIQAAYAKLAKKYHPNNTETGDKEKFESVNLAYEVLSDPLLRQEFDKVKGVNVEEGGPRFSGLEFFEALGREAVMRSALLCLLYDRRRTKPHTPSLSVRHVEGMIEATSEELASSLWYLKQRNLVRADDKSSLHITVDGMDFLEKHAPAPEAVMPLFKKAALAAQKPAAPESVRSVMARAVARK